jgi:hypothetical protein
VDLATFRRRARALWDGIPPRFKEGVSALVISPDAERREPFEDGWLYGWCEPDPVVASLPDAPVVSRITLFYGSFVEIAADAPDFDWEAELWETLRHELQHHLEWRAGVDHLGDEDDAQDANDCRRAGLPFPQGFHRWGVPLGDRAWLTDGDVFLEAPMSSGAWARLSAEGVTVSRAGLTARCGPVGDLGNDRLRYLDADEVRVDDADQVPPFGDVVVVVFRKRWWWPW